MSELKLSGRISYIGGVAQISEKFSKRDFAIEVVNQTNDGTSFTQLAAFQMVNNQCPVLNNFKVGDEVTVNFNVRSNMTERDGVKRLFTNLTAWRIERIGQEQQVQPKTQQPPLQDDDLPF